jgi:hypothetical protein
VNRALEQLCEDRYREPEGRDRIRTAALSRDVLAGNLSLVDASPDLSEIGSNCGAEKGYLFSELRALLDDIREFPTGPERRHWIPEALETQSRRVGYISTPPVGVHRFPRLRSGPKRAISPSARQLSRH